MRGLGDLVDPGESVMGNSGGLNGDEALGQASDSVGTTGSKS
jgi:hypothetical protein